MSIAELKERHVTATETVRSLREQLKQRRQLLLDTDVATYAKSHGKSAVNFSSTDLVCCRTLQGHNGKVYSLDWTPEKNRIVSAAQDGRLIVWNALTSQKTHAIKLPCAWVMTCAFSPDGQSVACGGLDSVCSIFNLNSQADRDGNTPASKTLTGHKGYVSSCQYIPDDGNKLITSSGDQTCGLWDVTTGQRISVFGGEFPSGHTADVLSVSINNSNSNMFVSGSCDATARLWDARIASRAVHTYHGHEGDVNTVKFFPDGQRFGTGSDDGTCRLFDMRTGHQLQIYSQQHGDNDSDAHIVTSIAFSISGRLLFTGHSNGYIYVWDTLMAEAVLNLPGMSRLGFRVTHTYGLSETYGPSVVCARKPEWDELPLDAQVRLLSRQGVPYVGLEGLDVVDPTTMRPVPSDGASIGEIVMRGNVVMKGYLKNPKANEEAFAGGWYHSGDLGVRHPDGYVEVKDRAKDIIISGGENISSLEVESVMYAHPAVLEVSVVARADERWGESPCAFVTLKESVVGEGKEREVMEDIMKFCRERMPGYWVPKSIVFGPLPKTATGKVQKHLLRARAKEMGPVKKSRL